MKNVIVAISILLVIIIYIIFQGDFNQMERQQSDVKDKVDIVTSTACLAIDSEYYGDGWIVYKYDKAINEVNNLLNETLDKNSYYEDKRTSYVYFFDDATVNIGDSVSQKGAMHKYVGSKLSAKKSFKWGSKVSDITDIKDLTGQDFVIDSPCVVSVLNMGNPRMRLDNLAGKGLIQKLSIYEYKTD